MNKRHFIQARCYDKRGVLLSVGFNSYTKSHPLMKTLAKEVGHSHDQIYLHAEIHAILKCGDKPIHRIVVERYARNGFPACAKPCPICQRAIALFGIRIVEHT
jgi:tRNA(Arg) A34 adenosine deaminase TadA